MIRRRLTFKPMMLTAMLTCMMLLNHSNVNAQDDIREGFKKNIFVELLGPSLFGINYDMRLKRGQVNGLGFRIGMGAISVVGTDDVTGEDLDVEFVSLPIMANYLFGSRRSFLDVGAGVDILNVKFDGVINNTFIDESGFTPSLILNVGYRFQAINKGLLFKIDWAPWINSSGISPKWLGIGLGYSF